MWTDGDRGRYGDTVESVKKWGKEEGWWEKDFKKKTLKWEKMDGFKRAAREEEKMSEDKEGKAEEEKPAWSKLHLLQKGNICHSWV